MVVGGGGGGVTHRCTTQVSHPAALSRGRSIMQYVALVECLQLVRNLASKSGMVAAAVATKKGGSNGGASAAGPMAVKGMEELAHALGALEALLSEGAGETSASGEKLTSRFLLRH